MYPIFEIIPTALTIDLLFPQLKYGKQIKLVKNQKKFGKSK